MSIFSRERLREPSTHLGIGAAIAGLIMLLTGDTGGAIDTLGTAADEIGIVDAIGGFIEGIVPGASMLIGGVLGIFLPEARNREATRPPRRLIPRR